MFVAIDGEFHLETFFPLSCWGIGLEKGRAMFVEPKSRTALAILWGQCPDTSGAGRIEHDLDRLAGGRTCGCGLAQFKDGNPELALVVIRSLHYQRCQRLRGRIRSAALHKPAVLVIALLRVDVANGIVVLDVIVEVHARYERRRAAGHGIQ